jgi:hypothetical protein
MNIHNEVQLENTVILMKAETLCHKYQPINYYITIQITIKMLIYKNMFMFQVISIICLEMHIKCQTPDTLTPPNFKLIGIQVSLVDKT